MLTTPRLLSVFALAVSVTLGSARAQPAAPEEEIGWLVERSMLHQAGLHARRWSGTGKLWRHPFGTSQPRRAVALSSVWFTAYPASILTAPGKSVVATLGDPALWKAFQELGVTGLHTGPMKRSGGLQGREYTPTVDGMFDRIALEIEPSFGSEAEYLAMARTASDAGGVIIGDVIPGHTGRGADFLLALRAYGDYPGIYHMVEIDQADWGLLPAVPEGRLTVNLAPAVVDQLEAKGYVVGRLTRTIFYEPGVKDTDWSASGAVAGVDGKTRRWVYLHYFKEGQPTLNWLDPSFAAHRVVIGDAIHSIGHLGEKMLRLDANGFLGIEGRPGEEPAWSEGHPFSGTANQLIAGTIRKLGGFSFQELNLTLEDIARSAGGADLSYDFVTRPAYHHALATGDARFLRLMIELGEKTGIPRVSLIHALQNHDELTLELVHFWTTHREELFTFRGAEVPGATLRETVQKEMFAALADRAPYNLKASNGISCTTATVVAAALGIPDMTKITEDERKKIRDAHLLLVLYNAMQPGVFAFSGWDLVGSLTLAPDQVKELMVDGDTRWVNRGAYDLMGLAPDVTVSAAGLPRAAALYGPIPAQLGDPESFASRMKAILAARKRWRLAEAEPHALPATQHPGLLVMAHRLPEGGIQVTALNFAREAVSEEVVLDGETGTKVLDLLHGDAVSDAPGPGRLRVELAPLSGSVLLLR